MSDKKIAQDYIEQIADMLWLSKIVDNPQKRNNRPIDKKEGSSSSNGITETAKPPVVEAKIIEDIDKKFEVHTSEPKTENEPSIKSNKSAKAFSSPKKLELSNYREWEKAFKFINLKKHSKTKTKIDIDKSVEEIALTHIFDIKEKKVLEKYYSLTIIIDKGETMTLWEDLIKLFVKMIKTTAVFNRVDVYYWDTTKTEATLFYDREFKQKIDDRSVANGAKELLWILSDCLAPSWKNGDGFKRIKSWSKYSFVSLIHMFPKHMWMGTMLYKGKHTRFRAKNYDITNNKLDTAINTDRKSLKLPVVSFEPFSLQAWAKVVTNSFDNSISGVVFDSFEFEIQEQTYEPTIKERLERFNTQASPLAQRLAWYMSVLPIDFQVARILQEEKLPNTNQSHVAEVFLGGLIKREKIDDKTKYDFYPDIREKLNQNLSVTESFEILEKMSNFLTNHFGEAFDFKALISDPTGVFQGDIPLSDESIAFAQIVANVLDRAGGEFSKISKKINSKVRLKDSSDILVKVKEALKDREFEEILHETVYIGGNPKDGDYIEGTVSMFGTFEDDIEFLEIEENSKDMYNIKTSFSSLCYVEFEDISHPNLTKEVELSLDVEATLKVKFKDSEVEKLVVTNITIDEVDGSQIDELEKPNIDETQAIIPKSKRFQMGSEDGKEWEKPIHEVVINYDFEIAQYPVTFDEYDLFCEDTDKKKPDDEGWGRGKRPVINVSWHDAKAYCEWLNKKLGLDERTGYYRLPTEAEWEYSCRAGTTTKWSFGDDEKELTKYAWYDKNSDHKTHPVGEKLPNPWGLYDMHGNVWDWCEDDYVKNYHNTPRDGTAHVDKKADYKVLRGGSWFSGDNYTLSANRNGDNSDYRVSIIGFRLLRVIKGKSKSEK